jgi:membrane fusion protein (multidrug efflux system)
MSDDQPRTSASPADGRVREVGQERRDQAPGPSAGSAPHTDGEGPAPVAPKRARRRFILPVIAGAVVFVVAAGVAWWLLNAGWVKTDNAQTAGDLFPISARVSGTVLTVPVHQDQFVKAGTVLLTLDPAPYRVALDQAQMQLAQARAQVEAARAALAAQQQTTATNISAAQAALAAAQPTVTQAQATLKQQAETNAKDIATGQAQVDLARAKLRSVQAQLVVAQRTVGRDRELLRQGAIARQQLDLDTSAEQAVEAQVEDARSALAQAEAQLAAYIAASQGVVVAQQQVVVNREQVTRAVALVQQARAGEAVVEQLARQLAAAEAQAGATAQAVRNAELNLAYTVVRAPADGWVVNWTTGPTVEVGQVVQPNQPLLYITGTRVWVMANVKETELGRIRVGDPVRITVDALRGRTLHGHVASIGSTTGSTTALLPPDNATGNFVKVVQLVPVRIEFDHDPTFYDGDPDSQIPVGVSAEVAIDARHHPQPRRASGAR